MADVVRADEYAEAILGDRWRRQGGVVNPVNGLNVSGLDATRDNRVAISLRTDWDLSRLYLSSGLAARIVDAPADDALARGFEIEGDDDEDSIQSECERLDTTARIAEAVRWSRLYGGAVIVMIVEDGGMLPDPLNENNIREIKELKVFDATQVVPAPGQYYSDPAQPNFGLPSVYQLISPLGGVSFFCHESRILTFSGDPFPVSIARMLHNGLLWRGRSALEGCYDDIVRYTAALQWSERMLERKQQAVYTMEGLANLLQNGLKDLAVQRISAVDVVRSVMNTVVIDGGTGGVGGDKYEVRDLNLTGVTDQISQFQMSICADTGFPVTVLFGRSPAGHNATGESDMESYYRMVGHIQDADVLPPLRRIIELILKQKDYKGKQPDKWTVKANPLWVPSEKDQAQSALWRGQGAFGQAQAAQIYVDLQSMTPVEVRDDLIAQDKYGIEGDINPEDLPKEPDPPPPPVSTVIDPSAALPIEPKPVKPPQPPRKRAVPKKV